MRGSVSQFLVNIRASRGPLVPRLALAVRNYARRFAAVPPRTCCGHPGEPGC